MTDQLTVLPLPAGAVLKNCEVVAVTPTSGFHAAYGNVFVKTSGGDIYVLRRRSLDLLQDFACSDKDRRAYAKLAGIKFSSIQARRKVRQAQNKMADSLRSLALLKRSAAQNGFRLVKTKGA